MTLDRRPPARMESRNLAKTIRFTEDEWTAISDAALSRHLEPAPFVRILALYALRITETPGFLEAPVGVLGQKPRESQRMRRF